MVCKTMNKITLFGIITILFGMSVNVDPYFSLISLIISSLGYFISIIGLLKNKSNNEIIAEFSKK